MTTFKPANLGSVRHSSVSASVPRHRGHQLAQNLIKVGLLGSMTAAPVLPKPFVNCGNACICPSMSDGNISRELFTPLFWLPVLALLLPLLLALFSALLICPQATNIPALNTVVTPKALTFFNHRAAARGEEVAKSLALLRS